ncbi:hypothetical protein AVEN_264125-1 [Araneus ventricosus]|uniref:Uncharacterized protein n=1 Tax=Araneus ventricosus TaxID=182803 RepID=A0A4Y2P417_ARAVE|nr:hypothetical protein AVEN_264125-1 [Araneus ventricosus]
MMVCESQEHQPKAHFHGKSTLYVKEYVYYDAISQTSSLWCSSLESAVQDQEPSSSSDNDSKEWEYVKHCVYQMPCTYLHELKHRVLAPEMLMNTWREIEYHLDILCATTGSHINII